VPTSNREKMSAAGPLEGADGDPGAPTINVKKHPWWAPWQVLMEI
jgi:hypothetical protein